MQNAGLEEAQAGIKIAGRNINNLRYADDTTLMAESEEELKSLLMKVKEESEEAGLTLNIQKTKTMVSGPIALWQIAGAKMETVTDFIFLGSKITAKGDCSHEIKGYFLLGRKSMANLDGILKSRDITLPTKVCIVKAMVFPVQFSSVSQSSPTLCDPMDCSTPGFCVHYQFPELAQFMSINSVMPSNHLILCLPLLLLPSIFPSIRIFSSKSALPIRRPKYWSFSLSISPSNEYSGLIFLLSKGHSKVFSSTIV